MRAAKVDANHSAIVDALRAAGCFVQSLAKIGGGCPDLAVARDGHWYMVEVKDIGGRLTPAQKVWHRDSAPHARTHIAYTVADALLIVGAK